MSASPDVPRQRIGCRSLAWWTWRRYSASRAPRRGSSANAAAAAKVHSPARNTLGDFDDGSSYRGSPTLSANHKLAGATDALMPRRARMACSSPSAMDGRVSDA